MYTCICISVEKEQRKKQKKCSNITQTVFTKRKGVKKEMRKLKQQAARNHGIRKKKTLVGNVFKLGYIFPLLTYNTNYPYLLDSIITLLTCIQYYSVFNHNLW